MDTSQGWISKRFWIVSLIGLGIYNRKNMPEIQLLLRIFFNRTSNSLTFFDCQNQIKINKIYNGIGYGAKSSVFQSRSKGNKIEKKN